MDEPLEHVTRRFERKRPRPDTTLLQMPVQPCHADPVWTIRDISRGGIGLVTSNAVPRSAKLKITIQGPHLTPPFQRPGTVVWCQPAGTEFLVGVSFDQELSVAEFQQIAQAR